jgi:hypothetical protein
MDVEFHYYIAYILCRKAGFEPAEAYLIAYSSQYTDDNVYQYKVNYENGGYFINPISQTLDITKPSKVRQKIFPLFHFVPGGREAERKCSLSCGRGSCFLTVANSNNSRALLDAAFESNDLYRIGIAIHAYADTWSHQNFVGFNDKINAQRGLSKKLIPNICHSDFINEPDKINNEWVDKRLPGDLQHINNTDRFLEAAREIFIRLYRYKHPGSTDAEAQSIYGDLDLEEKLGVAMEKSYWFGASEDARISAYKKLCSELRLKKYRYHPKKWKRAAIRKKPLEMDLFDKYWARSDFTDSDWYRFQSAVAAHRDFALDRFQRYYQRIQFDT